MTVFSSRISCWLSLTVIAFFAATLSQATAVGQEKVDFVRQIKPIFEKHCLECHGPEDDGNAFRIDVRSEAMDYLTEGSADDSEFYMVMTSDDEDEVMPPKDYEHQTNRQQIALVKRWIDEGADWPEDVKFVKYVAPAEGDDPQTAAPAGDGDQTDPASEKSVADQVADEDAPVAAVPLDPKVDNALKALGSLHPAAVHLPIGLLLASGLFALLSLRGNFVMSDCAYYCLWLGTLGAIFACATGWYWSWMENKGTVDTFMDIFDTNQKVYWHRLGGFVVAILGLVLALFAANARSKDPDEGATWKILAIILAVGVGWVGHTGGELHYGSDHDKYIEAVWQDLTGGGEQAPDQNVEPQDGAPQDKVSEDEAKDAAAARQPGTDDDADAEDDTSEVGKTSGEPG